MMGEAQEKRLTVVADDFGLSQAINEGIIDSYLQGITTTAALLVNAPATSHAIELSRRHPRLEIGLHLGIVEGYCLSALPSLLDPESYFGDGRPCLRRNWKMFLLHYLKGMIDLEDVRQEWELQIIEFKRHFKTLHYINCTQHLHLLPGLFSIFSQLCLKYDIKYIRLPRRPLYQGSWLNPRFYFQIGLQLLSLMARPPKGLVYHRHFFGFIDAGKMTDASIMTALSARWKNGGELMMHPGEDCPELRRMLPDNYNEFNWSGERDALASFRLKKMLLDSRITPTPYCDFLEHSL